jgi:PAT family beta-lactamase induction signal transducer AmpG
MLLGIVATLQAREPAQNAGARPGLRDAVVRPLGQFWQVWGLRSVVLAAFVLLFKLPDQMAGAITTPLLMNGLGYSSEAIGGVNQVFGFGMTIVGAAAGGWMVARFGLVRCLWAFGIAHCVSIVGFLVLALAYGATVKAVPAVAPPIWPLIPVIGVENVVIGMVTSGFVAFLMQICDRRYTATQYALLTALMAAGNALAGKFGGILAAQLDYPLFLVAAMLSGVPALALIAFVQPPESSGPSKTA